MTSLSDKYNHQDVEDKWYEHWLKQNFFHSEPDDRTPFCIVIPPPNVTGILHMGHVLNNTIQDILVRRARMQGFNACWVPGTDHASIATEAKVVAKLKAEGVDKKNLTREEFLKHAWDWKEKQGGIILEQLKKLGCSCDWERTRFTMDEALYESVIDVFVDLYNKGLIYKGVRMVNWDPKALTAVSDEEVIYHEVQSKLYYVRYKIENSENEYVTIATTRPETILGDVAVCMHPEDERFKHLKGKRCLVPLINRSIPLIFDEYVDREFGTGALKITPAHDINDYQIGITHKLPSINIFNDNGTLNENAEILIGTDRFEARKQIIPLLETAGNLVKIEDYTNKIGFSERTNEIIEPKLSQQWFCNMAALAKPALEVVMNDTIRFFPDKLKNTYSHWMENVKDWCISRQLWWGQRIPAYYAPNGEFAVAKTKEEAFEKLRKSPSNFEGVDGEAGRGSLYELRMEDLQQDEDVMDTWFSSWLWPISVFDGIRFPDNEDIKYYYPTNVLVTAPDIIFFWVARMIMAGLEWRKEIPFHDVYYTGMVRDKLGRKMSKSLGNSPDPIELMNKYGADGVRMGMLLTSPAGNDLPFDETLCELGRNFSNKIWNALRLVKGWERADTAQPDTAKIAIDWIEQKLDRALSELDDDFSKYRLSESLMRVYKLIWDDFCSWYLEMIKPPYQQPIDRTTYQATIQIFEKLMKILHPFMPFLTEEVYQQLQERNERDSIMVSNMPKPESESSNIIEAFELAQEKIGAIRQVRNEKNIPQKTPLELFVKASKEETALFDGIIAKLCNLTSLTYIQDKQENMLSLMVRTTEMFIPLENSVNKEEELKKLEADLIYYEGFMKSVQAKLSNEKFVAGAPTQVVENERKKLADAEEKLRLIKEQIRLLQ